MVKVGDEVGSSAWLGQVDENFQPLKIMVPFQLDGTYKVKSIVKEGEYGIEDTVVVLTDKDGKRYSCEYDSEVAGKEGYD